MHILGSIFLKGVSNNVTPIHSLKCLIDSLSTSTYIRRYSEKNNYWDRYSILYDRSKGRLEKEMLPSKMIEKVLLLRKLSNHEIIHIIAYCI